MSAVSDLVLVPDKSGHVEFLVRGKSADSGLLLLQRLYALLFVDQGGYRGGEEGYGLLDFLDGANTPPDDVMDSMLAICCAYAVQALDSDDRALVRSFSGYSSDGEIICTLEMVDGTTISGTISNV